MNAAEIRQLANKVHRHPSTVFRWLKGSLNISSRDAVALERATGIDRRAWLWPEEFENPYFPQPVSAPPCAEAEKRTAGA